MNHQQLMRTGAGIVAVAALGPLMALGRPMQGRGAEDKPRTIRAFTTAGTSRHCPCWPTCWKRRGAPTKSCWITVGSPENMPVGATS
jgi:hypothetical protein